ncbi:hypothetical protein SDRG_11979 [Saprolegnia diclina VS20]|uniref:F-box domain-containing protein n=1 Tax=Saprolegnia diclina (strain VS20) TaxID=1156394 RepID=T0PXY9_SAPDV|nr:hypothetical protein SDRG_11979 [Saprolegnia diclina VS20]EQC30404.1 hypothetical protein SDRG_11979 [Saprolegnia diclina VS20]|eukprot:XP_008616257.1 hypothetical protein SDRG_11979 [Saprolegnia diclina VS20]
MIAAPIRRRTRRDEDAEALEQALNESLQPDFLAQIVHAENELRHLNLAARARASASTEVSSSTPAAIDDDDDDDVDAPEDVAAAALEPANLEDLNADVLCCHMPERMLMLVLEFLDEDTIGNFSNTCHHFHRAASNEYIYEMMCRRVFTMQSRGRAVKLGKFSSWAHMFRGRPRVKYHGFYALRISYYKEPEWNMWTDLPKNAILLAIYYRYFNFRNDGTFLYAMTHRHPRETAELMRHRDKETIFVGNYYLARGQVHAVVPMRHGTLEFIFRMASRWRAPNTQLVMLSHALYQPSDVGLQRPHYFDVNEEAFNFRRFWHL